MAVQLVPIFVASGNQVERFFEIELKLLDEDGAEITSHQSVVLFPFYLHPRPQFLLLVLLQPILVKLFHAVQAECDVLLPGEAGPGH